MDQIELIWGKVIQMNLIMITLTKVRCSSFAQCTCKSLRIEAAFTTGKPGRVQKEKGKKPRVWHKCTANGGTSFAKQLHFITAPTQHISINRQCQTTTHSNNSSLQNTHPQLSALAVQINENVSLYKEGNIFCCKIACRLGVCVRLCQRREQHVSSQTLFPRCYHYHPFPPSLFPLLSYSLAGHSFTLVKR